MNSKGQLESIMICRKESSSCLFLANQLPGMEENVFFTMEDRAEHLHNSDAFPARLKTYLENLELLKAKGEYASRIPSYHALKKWRTKIEREKILAAVSGEFYRHLMNQAPA